MDGLPPPPKKQSKPSVFTLLKPYHAQIFLLALLSLGASGLGLVIPKIISKSIDAFAHGTFNPTTLTWEFSLIIGAIFVCTYLQNVVQTITSERVAKDLRTTIASKIANQSYAFIEKVTPAKLLTNLTGDVDSIKMLVGQAIPMIISSLFTIIGAAIFLLTINWKLALAVLTILPLIGVSFGLVLGRVRALMLKGREIIDWLNKVINESILGATLIRVLNSQNAEAAKFKDANARGKELGLQILQMFAALIPTITFIANLGALTILTLGGHFVISGSMSLGDFAAFTTYINLLIFPLIVMGIMSNFIAQAQASYDRVGEILTAEKAAEAGTLTNPIQGEIEFRNVTLTYGEKSIVKDVSFVARVGTKTALIGPTAAGKTQLLHLLTRLTLPTEGSILINDTALEQYEPTHLHTQIGFVFQDSVIFNLTLRENIAFGGAINETDLQKAIETAELSDFIATLPQGLETLISERGASLSGGQKQRIMLARALALNPKILLLDDFTARVDAKTEQKILSNLKKNYPTLTLISVTQKIASVEHYDQILLVMEGEVLARGTHEELLKTSPEYAQIAESQKSTNHYE